MSKGTLNRLDWGPPDFLKVVADTAEVCPYLPEQTARMPLCIAIEEVTPRRMDELLAAGYRRTGRFFYRTVCPECQACEPIRVHADRFVANRSQRRAEKLGDHELKLHLGPPQLDRRRIALFNAHRSARGLDHGGNVIDGADYQGFLLDAPVESVELSFWYQNELIAVSILDVGETSLSAVYCYFDPSAAKFSPGTFSILKQLRIARQLQRPWLYLGLYVEANAHLNYKARFRPNQRLVAGAWQDFD